MIGQLLTPQPNDPHTWREVKGRLPMRTITGYGIAVIIFLAILNGVAWLQGNSLGCRSPSMARVES